MKKNIYIYLGGGGPEGPLRQTQGYQTGPILLPRHPLTYINLHIKYGSNPIRIF